MIILYPIYIGLIFILNHQIVFSLNCLDENGVKVDYTVIYKPPKTTEYFQISSKSLSFAKSNKNIDNKNSMIGQTFDKIYENFQDYSYVMYNDKNPKGTRANSLSNNLFPQLSKYAKSKGVLVWDNSNKKAIWVLHSIPRFPSPFTPASGKNEYQWPETSKSIFQSLNYFPKLLHSSSLENAHMALCISVKFENVIDILKSLIIADVKVYDVRMASDSVLQKAKAVIESNSKKKSGFSRLFNPFGKKIDRISLNTPDNESYFIHTKSKNQLKNIYKIMSDNEHSKEFSILSQSFTAKISSIFYFKKFLRSKCGNNFSKILKIKIGETEWSSKVDDSHWLISSGSSSYFCFTDGNKRIMALGQSNIMVCFTNKELHQAFNNAAIELSCEK